MVKCTIGMSVFLIAVIGILLLILGEEIRFRRLSELERERRSLVAVLSHQLRTHMTSVKWYTDMLLNKEFGKLKIGQLEALDKVNLAAVNSDRILERLLGISQVEQGDVVLAPVSLDVCASVKQIVKDYKYVTKHKNVRLVQKCGKKRLTAFIDAVSFHSIVESLLSNAVHYTSEGGTVTVGLKEKKNAVEVYVQDTGIGIPEAEKKFIFEKFFRGKEALLACPDGNGLGLYLVKKLIENAGGKIHFESREGEGTTFTVSLPIRRA